MTPTCYITNEHSPLQISTREVRVAGSIPRVGLMQVGNTRRLEREVTRPLTRNGEHRLDRESHRTV
ncbi:hypothetical protein J6590_024750 [Homalodisca vitripennis]|nr:hypothetical protein J6590_024750 [Homalodisca vitripennis]